jgi:WD40 repeat protein
VESERAVSRQCWQGQNDPYLEDRGKSLLELRKALQKTNKEGLQPPPTRSCEKYATLKGHTDAVSALAWSPDGKRLVSAAESTIILWDTTVSRFSISQDDLAYAEALYTSLQMGAQLAYLPETHQDMVSQIQWISDEEGFVTAGMDQKIIKWVGHRR